MGRIAVVVGAFNGRFYFLLLCGASGSVEISVFSTEKTIIRDLLLAFVIKPLSFYFMLSRLDKLCAM